VPNPHSEVSVKLDVIKLKALAEQLGLPAHKVIGAIDQGLRRLDSELQETSQGREHY
jgi:hypothetical protein